MRKSARFATNLGALEGLVGRASGKSAAEVLK
jgi:hypothetical protein